LLWLLLVRGRFENHQPGEAAALVKLSTNRRASTVSRINAGCRARNPCCEARGAGWA